MARHTERAEKARCRRRIAGFLACSILTSAAEAQTVWTGAISNDPTVAGNWLPGVVPVTGTIVNINTLNNAPVLGAGQSAVWRNTTIGGTGTGLLTVRDGGTLAIGVAPNIAPLTLGGGGSGPIGNGTLLVTGSGSLVAVTSSFFVATPANSIGTVTVDDGAILRALSLNAGTAPGSVARVTVSNGGLLDMSSNGSFSMGNTNGQTGSFDARLTITGGGRVIGGASTQSTLGVGTTLLISGAGSELSAPTLLNINGAARIADGGELRYQSLTVNGDARVVIDGGAMRALVTNSSAGLSITGNSRVDATNGTIQVGAILGLFGNSVLTLNNTNVQAGSVGLSQNATLVIGAPDGSAPVAAGTFVGDINQGSFAGNATVVVNHNGQFNYAGGLGGNTVFHRAGVTTLTNTANAGPNQFNMTGGTLVINGFYRPSAFALSGGATLAGRGQMESIVTVQDGIIAPGEVGAVGALRLGRLILNPASILNFQLGAPGGTAGVTSDLIRLGTINVGGNLTLDGTLNIADAGGFGAGVYRLIDYNGSLVNNGLLIGARPAGFAASDLTLQTSVARQVNLLVGSPSNANFWDGAETVGNGVVDGGSGIWTATRTNWTTANGVSNSDYDPASLLVFAAAPGTVTIDNSAGQVFLRNVLGNGAQFAADGYRVAGGALRLDGTVKTLRIGDGTAAGASFVTTIDSALTGTGGLNKTDIGTLRLTGANSFTGDTDVAGGMLALIGGAGTSLAGAQLNIATVAGVDATVALTNGAVVTSSLVTIGMAPNAAGLLTVREGSTITAQGELGIGGNARLRTSGNGTVLISGTGSSVTVPGQILVAASPGTSGTLTVENGAILRGSALNAGAGLGAVANIIVRDNSLLDISAFGGIGLARNGGTAQVAITGGSRLLVGPSTQHFMESGSTLLISGAGSILSAPLPFLGLFGNVRIEDGGELQYFGMGLSADARIAINGGTLSIVRNDLNAGLSLTDNSRIDAVNGTILVARTISLNGNSVLTLNNTNLQANRVGGQSTSTLVIGAADGAAPVAAGTFVAQDLSVGTMVINHNSRFSFDGALSSNIVLHRSGVSTFGGADNANVDRFDLTGGSVFINGRRGATQFTLSGGATLGGSGQLNSSGITVQDGIIAPGAEGTVGTLTMGSLVLSSSSVLNYQLGAPGGIPGQSSDLIRVGEGPSLPGNLTLDGTLNVSNAGGFGAGLYRLIDYTGTLTDNGLLIGTVPAGFGASDLTVQTSVAREVNLLVGMPVGSFDFWDGATTAANGAVDGGTGTWSATGTNWTLFDGSRSGIYNPAAMLIFAGTPGTVTVDNAGGDVRLAGGAQFAVDGYRVIGGAIRLDAAVTPIRVGNGTAPGAAIVATIDSVLTGPGGIAKTDFGTLVLNGANSYSGDTIVNGGTLVGSAASLRGNISIGAALVEFDQATNGVFSGLIIGSGVLAKTNAGVLSISGASGAFAGTARVEAGTLNVTGELGGAVEVNGGTLAGSGRLAGPVTVTNGTVAPGNSGAVGALSVGALDLSAGSILNYQLGMPNRAAGVGSDFISIGSAGSPGNLTLDGTLNVSDAGGFGAGLYRLIGYTGSLTDRGLLIGATPAGVIAADLTVVTATPGEVNLLVGTPPNFGFWDGAGIVGNGVIDGGTGTWSATGTNWTQSDGSRNGVYDPAAMLIFAGTPGTVTVNNTAGAVSIGSSAQFAVDGYRVTGEAIRLDVAQTPIRVGDGTAPGAAIVATIDSALTGPGGLAITDIGILALNGANSFNGLDLFSGTVRVGSDLAAGVGAITFAGNGVLQSGGPVVTLANSIFTDNFSRIDVRGDEALILNGAVAGDDAIRKTGDGTLALNGDNSFAELFVEGGVVRVGSNTGAGAGTISLNGTLQSGGAAIAIGNRVFTAAAGGIDVRTGEQLTVNGVIEGTGLISKSGDGTLVLNGANTFNSLEIRKGVVRVGSDKAAGSGAIVLNATLQSGGPAVALANTLLTSGAGQIDVQNGDILTLNGNVSGVGSITKLGDAILVLNAGTRFDSLVITNGTVQVGNASAPGPGLIELGNLATLRSGAADVSLNSRVFTQGNGIVDVRDGEVLSFSNLIEGAGSISKVGLGTLALDGDILVADLNIDSGTVRFGNNLSNPTRINLNGDAALQSGAASSRIFNNIFTSGSGRIDVRAGEVLRLDGVVAGTGSISKTGDGTLELNGLNSYAGGTSVTGGTLEGNAASLRGDLSIGADSTAQFRNDNGGVFAGAIRGPGTFTMGGGELFLTGASASFAGTTVIASGTLNVNGELGGRVEVSVGATLAGNGRLGGQVNVQDGILSPGNNGAIGTLSLGSLVLSAGSILNFQLGAPGGAAGVGSDFISIGSTGVPGDLTLAGTLNVTDAGGFGAGIYRLIGYTGSLTDNGLAIGGTPTGIAATDLTVVKATPGQVNLLVGGAPARFGFWDGAGTTGNGVIDGGTGRWSASGTNWTQADGARNGVYNPAATLIFAGAPGTVTVDNSAGDIVLGNGAQFFGDGYTITGGAIRLDAATTTIRVGDGISGGTTFLATIDSALIGLGSVTKTDLGTLVLNGRNGFQGGLFVDAGTVRLGNDNAAGFGATAQITLATGTTLQSGAATVTLLNDVFTSSSALIDVRADEVLTLNRTVAGNGVINKIGGGMLVLNGNNRFGRLIVTSGTVRVGSDTAAGSSTISLAGDGILQSGGAAVTLVNNLETRRSGVVDVRFKEMLTLRGGVSGDGSISKTGVGTLVMTGVSTFSGSTTVVAGRYVVQGSLRFSPVTVKAGAVLAGNGRTGRVTVEGGGRIAPGNSIGTLNVDGGFRLEAGSIYEAEVSANGSDLIIVDGEAAIAGDLLLIPTETFTTFNTSLTLISATSRTGSFASISGLEGFGAAFAPTLVDDGTTLSLRLMPASLSAMGGPALTGNAQEVATAFDRATAAGYNPQPFFALYNQGPNLSAALNQLAGEVHSAGRRVLLQDTRVVREAAFDRLNAGLSSIGGQIVTSTEGETSVTGWMRLAGSWGVASADGIGSRFTTDQTGFLTGFDYAANGFTVGGMFHHTRTTVELASLGNSRIESTGGAIYGGWQQEGGFAVGAGGSIAGNTANSNRVITAPGLGQSLRGRVNGTTYQVFGELAYDLAKADTTRAEPFEAPRVFGRRFGLGHATISSSCLAA